MEDITTRTLPYPYEEASPAFSLELAFPVATWVEALLYGIYTSLFFKSFYIVLKQWKVQSRSRKVVWIVILLMYMVATIDAALHLYNLVQAYVWLRGPAGPVSYFFDSRQWYYFANGITFCLTTWLGDALVIYRCFIIWNQNYVVIILPFLLLLFSIGINATTIYLSVHPSIISSMPELIAWVNAIYLVNFVQNTLTTGLIVFKILHQHHISTAAGVRSAGSRLSLTHVVRIMVESALVYTVQLLVLIILYFQRHNAQIVLRAAIVPSIGIVFNLIAVRIHMTELGAAQTTGNAGISTWMVAHLGTMDGSSSRRVNDEVSSTRLKQIRAFVQAESLDRYSGHSRSLDAR